MQRIVLDSGASTDQAEATARSQVGLRISLFSDFTADSSKAGQAAAIAAQWLVLATQQQSGQLAALKGRVGCQG
ncbi:hypothetical protein AB4Z46_23620 [Variovorax sp. M-6]|uniref:hypothetical protein n=1 Tax=Variovorax sp. M-6 TaxID=3233041 RepID=UPI003F96EE16